MWSRIHWLFLRWECVPKSSSIAELNELLNTMNMASVLQGDVPPILFNCGIYI